MEFDKAIFFHCSPCVSVSLYSQPGKWRCISIVMSRLSNLGLVRLIPLSFVIDSVFYRDSGAPIHAKKTRVMTLNESGLGTRPLNKFIIPKNPAMNVGYSFREPMVERV